MTAETMLIMLKTDLGITATVYDARLEQLLTVAADYIQREGVTLNTASSVEDANLCIMYAAYLWKKRDSGEGMPRSLRWALNNRIFSEKARVAT